MRAPKLWRVADGSPGHTIARRFDRWLRSEIRALAGLPTDRYNALSLALPNLWRLGGKPKFRRFGRAERSAAW